MFGEENTISILHVDDEPGFSETAAAFLERENDRFDIRTETSPSDGLDWLADHPVDCIVSDYDMPRQNGIEFLTDVRERDDRLPFILYTGKGSEEIASQAIAAGVTGYLQKETGTGQYAVLANRITNAVAQYRAQRDLEASQNRLSLLIEQSPLGVIEYDTDGRIVRLNGAGEEILGYTEAELRGETWEEIVPDDSQGDVDEIASALLDDEGGYHSVDENVRKDGERIMCEWHNRVVTDDDGSVAAVFALFQDITERKERERRLEQGKARLEALYENSPDMIHIHTIEGTIVDVNEQFCETFDRPEDALVGRKVWDIDQNLDPDFMRETWNEMAVGEQREIETEFERDDGERFPVEVRFRRLPIDDGNRFVVISRDISDRKRREERLDEFASIVSHDLRSPLSVAAGAVELAREDCESPHLERAVKAHDRMDSLIDDLLTLARKGAHVREEEPVVLESLVQRCWTNVVTGDAVLHSESDQTIRADESRLKQLFENLLRNAVEHGGTDVTVTIGDLPDGFYIEDDGPGIPASQRDKVFEAGYSTDDSGTGFGLSIVKQVANAHDWETIVTEGSGGGARFEVTGVNVHDEESA
jgi:PAS domain S-box-containing protein